MIPRTWLGILLVYSAIPCDARDITVDAHGGGEYRSISQAIRQARPGDVVTILAGIYREEVVLQGKHGTAEQPVVVRGDPNAPPGAVVIDGSRVAPADRWRPFMSGGYGVNESHNIWWTGHDPDKDCSGNELMENCYPYRLHPGWYGWDGSPGGSARWGTCQLFKNGVPLQIAPSHPRAGRMADLFHADSEETQSEDYITALCPKFLKANQWIWYDNGRTVCQSVPELPEHRHFFGNVD